MGLFGGGGFLGGIVKAVVVAAAIAAAVYTGGASLGFTSAAFSMAGLSSAVGMAALYSAVAFTAVSLLSENMGTGAYTLEGSAFGNEIRGQLVTGKSPNAPARVVYGKTRLAGNIVYVETTGSTNQTLFQVATLAGHEITAVDEVYLNDDLFTTTYKGKSDVFFYDILEGQNTQSPSSLLAGTSASAYAYKGIACLITKFVYNQDVYTQGIPNVTVIVRGKKIYDPRTTLTAYSNNSALVILDYLKDAVYGMSATDAEIDVNSFITAANICDEQIRVGTTEPAVYESRYTTNGAFGSDQQPKDILKRMLTACGGVLTYTGGQWVLKVAKFREPALTITEDEIVGDIVMQASQSKRDIFNAVKGIYSSPLDFYQPVSFPPVTNALYEEEDGEVIWNDVQYPFTTSYATCQRLAKIELEKARQQIIVNISCNLKAFGVQPADNIYFTFDRYGWDQKLFEVLSWEFATKEDNGNPVPVINLTLKETAESVYDWNGGEETTVDPSPNTNLPNSFVVNAPSDLAATSQTVVLQDGTTQNGIVLTWNAPVSSFVAQYEVQWIRGSSNIDWGLISEVASTTADYGAVTAAADIDLDYGFIVDPVPSQETDYNSILTTTTNYTIVPVVQDVEYSIRVRAINILGVRSAFTSLTSTPVGDTTPPALVDSFTILSGYKQLTLTWNNPPETDFDYVEVFYNTVNNLLTSTRAGVIRASIFVHSGLGINQTYYYWTRTVDKSGNRSAFSSVTSGTTAFIDSDQFSEEVMNLFSEAGAYGIEPVATLPLVGDFDGQIKYDTTANKLYRWDATAEEWTDDIFSITSGSVDLASFAAGLEPISVVTSLPSASGYTGAKIVFLTTDGKLYRYVSGAWTTGVLAVDINGTLAGSNFSETLRPVEVVGSLPVTGNFVGRTVLLTTDGKLYRYLGSGWTASVNASDITGQVTNAQIEALAASKVTGTLTDAQIADLSAAKITGQITGTQITDGSVSTPKLSAGAVTTDKLTASAITADKIASNAVTSAKIEANAITTAKLAAGAVTADTIASSAVTTGKLAAEAVTADQIAANTITSGKIATGAITADLLGANSVVAGKIQAGAISATEIASNAITSDKIAANAITTNKIAANSITAGLIAASGVITNSAQINDGLITNAKIENLAVDTGKIADLAITDAKIANATISTAKIADAQITTAKIANAAITAAKITDATITTAKIGVAQIDTLRVAGQAVTSSSFAGANGFQRYWSGGVIGGGAANDTFSSSSIYANAGETMLVTATWTLIVSGGTPSINLRPILYCDGVEIATTDMITLDIWDGNQFSGRKFILNGIRTATTTGNHTFSLNGYSTWLYDYYYYTTYAFRSIILSAFVGRR